VSSDGSTSPDDGRSSPAADGAPRSNRAAVGEKVRLRAEDLCFSYGSVQVLFDVSLQIGEGEILAVLGSNGAGKSTTLRVLSGLARPSSGHVVVDGEDVTGTGPEGRVKRGVVLVPEVKGIFPDLTIEENLEVGAWTLRKDVALRNVRITKAFEQFPQLAARRRQYASTLSGGERQMLSLAKVFTLEPSVLLIDELSLGLAPSIVDFLVEEVRRYAATGAGVILVEQSVNVAQVLAHRFMVMEKGTVRYEGAAADLQNQPGLLAAVLLGGHVGEQV
jgi:branched-chain amino acid transport system ATP-binding protein